MPTVSIITPVYNAARWLPKTLECVRAQTFTKWEQILVDDGSSDASVEIITKAAHHDPRIRLIRMPHTGVPARARNLGLRSAKGRYLAFLDADDLWLENKLEHCVEFLRTNKCAFVYHDYRHMSHDGSMIGPRIHAPERLDFRTLHIRRGHGGCMSMVLDLQRIGAFEFPLNFRYLHEDFVAWLSIIRAGHVGVRVPQDLGRYRVSRKSRSGNKLKGALHTWRIYREISQLSPLRAGLWWAEYAWNSVRLYRYAAPRPN